MPLLRLTAPQYENKLRPRFHGLSKHVAESGWLEYVSCFLLAVPHPAEDRQVGLDPTSEC
jgi:hypothetical protein